MNSLDTSAYKKLFVKTAREYVAVIQNQLTNLLQNPQDSDAISQIYIGAHSLKSQSTAMGFHNLAALNDNIEHIFYEVREGKRKLNEKILLIILNSTKKMKESIDSIESNNQEIILLELIQHLQNAMHEAVHEKV